MFSAWVIPCTPDDDNPGVVCLLSDGKADHRLDDYDTIDVATELFSR